MSLAIKKILADEKKLNEIAKRAFDVVDVDKSNYIDRKELEQILKQVSEDLNSEPPSKENCDEVLNQLDLDKNGKIELNEFTEFIRGILQALLRK